MADMEEKRREDCCHSDSSKQTTEDSSADYGSSKRPTGTKKQAVVSLKCYVPLQNIKVAKRKVGANIADYVVKRLKNKHEIAVESVECLQLGQHQPASLPADQTEAELSTAKASLIIKPTTTVESQLSEVGAMRQELRELQRQFKNMKTKLVEFAEPLGQLQLSNLAAQVLRLVSERFQPASTDKQGTKAHYRPCHCFQSYLESTSSASSALSARSKVKELAELFNLPPQQFAVMADAIVDNRNTRTPPNAQRLEREVGTILKLLEDVPTMKEVYVEEYLVLENFDKLSKWLQC
eukprot:jgi/Chlat1/6977/Chrsp55S09111